MNKTERFGAYTFEFKPLCLKRGIEVINLTLRQLETLRLLVAKRGEPVPKAAFFEQVWHGDYVEDGNLTQTIFLLRKALGKLPDGGEYIETLPRIGYRLAPATFALATQDATPGPAITGTSPPNGHTGRAFINTQHLIVDISAKEMSDIKTDSLHTPSTDSGTSRAWSLQVSPLAILAVVVSFCVMAGYMHFASQFPLILRSGALTNDGVVKPAYAPLFLDGSRIFFTEVFDNKIYLAEAATLGGNVLRHPSPVDNSWGVGVSPDRAEVIFAPPWEGQDPPLIAMSVADQTKRPIGGLRGHAAAWSPDGKKLAVTNGRELLLADANGEQVRVLTRLPDVPFWPAWSPDGRRIRFSRQQGANRQSLWEIDSTGGPIRPLLDGSPHENQVCCGSFSPDGRYFIYVFDEGYQSSLWIKPESSLAKLRLGTKEHELAAGPLTYWRSPIISADGHVYAVGEQARGDLIRLNQGAGAHFETVLNGLSADSVAYSHDGRWIAYCVYPDGTLWRSHPDGSDRIQLSPPGEFVRLPQWSPDDQNILFLSSVAGRPRVIKEIPALGGLARTLVEDGLSQGSASFSPDGRRIAYSLTVEFGVAPERLTFIKVLDLESGNTQKLVGSEGLWKARWSPDPRYLAAVSTDRCKLMLYDFNASSWSEIANLTVNDLVWSNDGKTIYFDTASGVDPVLYSLTVASRKIQKVADLKEIRRTGFFGSHLSISQTGDILTLRDLGISEVYRFDALLP